MMALRWLLESEASRIRPCSGTVSKAGLCSERLWSWQLKILWSSSAGLAVLCSGTHRLSQTIEPWKEALRGHDRDILWQRYFVIRVGWLSTSFFFLIQKRCDWRVLCMCPLTSFPPNHPRVRLRHIPSEAGGTFHTRPTLTGIVPA